MLTGKDGLERNATKLRDELDDARLILLPHWQRFIRKPDSHGYVNLWVEAARASPYLIGHIDAVAYPIGLLLIVWGWIV